MSTGIICGTTHVVKFVLPSDRATVAVRARSFDGTIASLSIIMHVHDGVLFFLCAPIPCARMMRRLSELLTMYGTAVSTIPDPLMKSINII